MKKWNNSRRFLVSGIGLGLTVAVLATISVSNAIHGSASDAIAPGKLIVHEWGTFTSFSGSDGVQLDFRPLINEDLPDFVFDRQLQSGMPTFSKSRIWARVRMETPVTYFYTDRERTVRASVEFPKGLLTEFYPPVASMAPPFDPNLAQPRVGNSKLDWGEIDLIPVAALTPNLKDSKTASWLQGLIQQRILPTSPDSALTNGALINHYYHARETDSAFVHVRNAASSGKPAGDYIEKFLFYRGVGQFEQPLKVTASDDDQIRVINSGTQPIRSLFRVTVTDGTILFSKLNQLAAGATVNFPAAELQVTSQDLQTILADALVEEKLYPKEAVAMVKTWADSWFAEEGTRIFYMVPQETTEKLLPLSINPPADESVRVLVGRVEVIRPSIERQLMELVRLHAKQRAINAKRRIEENIKEPIYVPIPTPLIKLGRLVEPALVRIRELAKDGAVSGEASILLQECRAALEQICKENSLSATLNN